MIHHALSQRSAEVRKQTSYLFVCFLHQYIEAQGFVNNTTVQHHTTAQRFFKGSIKRKGEVFYHYFILDLMLSSQSESVRSTLEDATLHASKCHVNRGRQTFMTHPSRGFIHRLKVHSPLLLVVGVHLSRICDYYAL